MHGCDSRNICDPTNIAAQSHPLNMETHYSSLGDLLKYLPSLSQATKTNSFLGMDQFDD